jgi:hypothetical protein
MAKSVSPNTARYVAASSGRLIAFDPKSASLRPALTADTSASAPMGSRNSWWPTVPESRTFTPDTAPAPPTAPPAWRYSHFPSTFCHPVRVDWNSPLGLRRLAAFKHARVVGAQPQAGRRIRLPMCSTMGSRRATKSYCDRQSAAGNAAGDRDRS